MQFLFTELEIRHLTITKILISTFTRKKREKEKYIYDKKSIL